MIEIQSIAAVPAGNAWLLISGGSAAVYDTGFACTARESVRLAKEKLGGRRLERILLSHSHYDHAAGTAIFAEAFPEAEVCAGEHAAFVFTRPGARRVMRELNATAAAQYGFEPDDGSISSLRADRVLREGDEVSVGDCRFEVWETPGHTKCSLSFYCKEESLLLASETLGIPRGDVIPGERLVVSPCCMVGVEKSFRAIDRAIRADPDRILIPHMGVIRGEASRYFLRSAREWLQTAKDLVLSGRDRPMDELAAEWKSMFYDRNAPTASPEAAFDLNLRNILPAILKEYEAAE